MTRRQVRRPVLAAGCLVAGWLVAGCLVPGWASPAEAGGAASYDDPFAYCAAVGTVDAPGPPYDGPPTPELLVRKLKAASGAPAEAPDALFREAASWRCMEGAVYACTVGANLPCTTKADPGREPDAAMRAFCDEQPEGTVLPAVVTGRATIYAWRCSGGEAVAEGPPKAVDAAGFLADIWYRLAPD